MSTYLNELKNDIEKLPDSSLSNVAEKLTRLLPLRAVSCIQICNKLCTKSAVRKLDGFDEDRLI